MYSGGGEKRDIHRRKEQAVAFVLQVGQPDAGRLKHLGVFKVIIAQEDDPAPGEMTLQLCGVVAGDHDDLVNARLLQGGHHTLGNGDRTDVQHRFELAHAGTHSGSDDQGCCLHKTASFPVRKSNKYSNRFPFVCKSVSTFCPKIGIVNYTY